MARTETTRIEGTRSQLATWLGQHPEEKRYRLVELAEPTPEGDATPLADPKASASQNEGMLAALREISKRQQGRRHTDGSETDRLLREGRAGAMWGHEPIK